jgi:hypothetical protein
MKVRSPDAASRAATGLACWRVFFLIGSGQKRGALERESDLRGQQRGAGCINYAAAQRKEHDGRRPILQ